MKLAELKNSIHKKVDEVNDPDFLELVNSMIDNHDKVFQIPAHHLPGIEEGAADIANGDFIALDDLEKRYEKWLKE